MKLVEIAGHNIDPRMVGEVGPIEYNREIERYSFVVCAGGATQWRFRSKSYTEEAKRALLAAIESAQPEMTELDDTACCEPRARYNDDLPEGMRWILHPEYGWVMYQQGPTTCCVSWPKHGLNEKGGHLHGKDEVAPFPSDPPFSDYKPFYALTKAVDAEVAEAEQALDQAKAILAESRALPLTAPLPGDNGAMGASDALVGIECGPEMRGTFKDGKFVRASEVEDEPAQEWPTVSCADRCKCCRDDPHCPRGPLTTSDALVGVEASPELRAMPGLDSLMWRQ